MRLEHTKKQSKLIGCWAAVAIILAALNTITIDSRYRERLHQIPGYSSYAQRRAIMLNPMILVPWMVVVGLLLVWSFRPFSSQQEESQKLWGLALALFSLLGLAYPLIFR
jgi:hypothetical protein